MKMRKIIAVMAAVLMLLSILPMAAMAADTYELASSIAVGDKIIIFAVNDNAVLSTTQNSNNRGKTDATPNGTAITLTDAMQVITVEAGLTEGTYAFNVGNGYLFAASSSKNYLRTETTLSANSSWSVAIDESGVATIKATGSNTRNWLRYNKSSSIFACYGSGQNDIAIYKLSTGGTDEPECEHDWVSEQTKAPDCTNAGENTLTCSKCGESKTETVNALGHDWEIISEDEATCTAAGSTTYECATCGEDKTEAIPVLPHNYVDGFCSVCGEAQPLEVTIETFGTTGILAGDSSSISWTNGGFQFVNKKDGSTTNIRVTDADHYRAYKNSEVEISGLNGEKMQKVVINCTGTSYLFSMDGNTVNDGWMVSTEGTVVTYTAQNGAADKLIISVDGGQSRCSSVIITPYVEAPSDCEHDYVGVETQAPTCGADGVMTYTCSKCEHSYTGAILATGEHTYEGYVCSACGAIDYPAADSTLTILEANALGAVHATNTFSTNKYYVEGKVTKIENTTYGNLYIADEEGNQLLIYGTYSADGETRFDAMDDKPVVGDTIKVYGVIGRYNPNNEMKNGWIVAHSKHECVYDHDFDADCNICSEIRKIETPVISSSKSAMEMDEGKGGLAALFNIDVEGLAIKDGTKTEADFTNAKVNGYKLLSMGAIASNGASSVDIPVVYMYQLDEEGTTYAIRVKNIPADKLDAEITFTPYFVVEIGGEQVTIEGEAVVGSYDGVLNG